MASPGSNSPANDKEVVGNPSHQPLGRHSDDIQFLSAGAIQQNNPGGDHELGHNVDPNGFVQNSEKANASEEPHKWLRWSQRKLTMAPDAHIEPRPFVHSYVIARPRLLQYSYQGALLHLDGRRIGPINEETLHRGLNGEPDSQENFRTLAAETLDKQRDWLNLFVDLLWVGIISNISERFSSTAFADDGETSNPWTLSFLEFLVLFLSAWRLWQSLATFLNDFFRKDLLQSMFLVWIFILVVLFGNNAIYFREPGRGNIIIILYLITRGSFLVTTYFYSIFIPEIRREIAITSIILFPILGLWIGALFLPWPTKAAPVLPAIMLETYTSTLMTMPLGDWLLQGAPKRVLDQEKFVGRLQNFFVIILGEGVYSLINGSPVGYGLNSQTQFIIQSLMIYYTLYWIYFNGDHTRTILHATFRNRYTAFLFHFLHVTLFGSLLIFISTVEFVIKNSVTSSDSSDSSKMFGSLETDVVAITSDFSFQQARWTLSGTFGLMLFSMTCQSLLNRSYDGPGTLLIDNRFLRLGLRPVIVAVIMSLPVVSIENLSATTFLWIIVWCGQSVIIFEYIAGMQREAHIFEPKVVENM